VVVGSRVRPLGATLLALASAACGDSFASAASTSAAPGAGGATTTSPSGGAGGATVTGSPAGGAGGAAVTGSPAGGAGGAAVTGSPAGGAGGATVTGTASGGAGGAPADGCALHPGVTLCEDFDGAADPTNIPGWTVGSADHLALVSTAVSTPRALRAKVTSGVEQSWIWRPVTLPSGTTKVRAEVSLDVLSAPAGAARAVILRLRLGQDEGAPVYELRLVGAGLEVAALGGGSASKQMVAVVPTGAYHTIGLLVDADGVVRASYGGVEHQLALSQPRSLEGATITIDVGVQPLQPPGQDVEVYLDDLTVDALN
jgi:hypothetical protein